MKPNLTVSFGVRYVRDTGRSDADLPAVPTIDLWGAGLGNAVHQPNKNFAPQLGIAYDPGKNGKTVLRGGVGLYYENTIFNNIMFDRPGRLPKGLFWGYLSLCPNTTASLPGGTELDASAICGGPIGNAIDFAKTNQPVVQDAYAAAGASDNPNYIDNNFANGGNSTGNNFMSPDYRTPFSWQFNFGIQRELVPGTVLSVDYVRNVGLHWLLGYDTNHIGDARYLHKAAALAAIDATNTATDDGTPTGVPLFTSSNGTPCPAGLGGIDCVIGAGGTMVDYAGFGLDSGVGYLAGYPAFEFGLDPSTGAAFPGINPAVGENQMLFPIGRSTYNALQVSLRSNKANPFRGVKNMSLQVSYSLSRYASLAEDQDFAGIGEDFANLNRYTGPTSLDRTHQLAFGGVFDLPAAFRLAYSTSIGTAYPATLRPPTTGDPGEIYRTDFTGDGTTADILPGTNVGAFGRSVRAAGLNNVITNFNNNVVGTLTPAGQALVDAGLFSKDQMIALGATPTALPLAPANQVNNDSSLNSAVRMSWILRPHKIWKSMGESLVIEPGISIYNVFNFANYGRLGGTLDGSPLSVNGTTAANRTNKIYLGSGIFAYGAPRTFEWGIRFTF